MAFNWFRRQFNQPEDASESTLEDTAPASASDSETTATDREPAPEPEAVQEDYLAWAKAAYQNIQQRQQTSTEPTEAVEAAPIPASAPESVATDISEEPADASAQEVRVPVPAPSVPVWAAANAERQARLERLKATAIEEVAVSAQHSAPPIPTAPIAPPSPAEPGVETEETADSGRAAIAFDDGFLWSAEVLAAQGRKPEDISVEEISWLQKLRQGLGKTRRGFVNQIKAIVGQGPLDQDAVMEIESLLLLADVGVEATDAIVKALQAKMREETLPPEAAFAYLKTILRDILDAPLKSKYSPVFAPEKNTLNIWLMTGVNGAGKTTTIGKIAHVATESGFNCLVAAADTFRAAAVEQVKVWAKRSNVEVIANPGQNTDPAAVVFDAIAAAQSRQTELLLVDTAGRLQNKKNLMDELRKVRQIIDKKAPHSRVESLLVLDATLGQNGLRQAQIFAEAAQLSGVVLTKLDGTAKGGVALAVVQQLGLPIRFIGAGEGIKDLRPFSSYEFVEALLSS
ncbi:signal recognition particle-docking protein FtsY [Altericista sp. CCNU0014]|uniref:signal recognition particle-docking protein FtsY n=1 Tax=Altericista sp. CCNU0014 TaxID=3082949 RepID=UPI0038503B45